MNFHSPGKSTALWLMSWLLLAISPPQILWSESSESILIRASRVFPVASSLSGSTQPADLAIEKDSLDSISIQNGEILIEDGRIAKIGKNLSVSVDTRVIEVKGSVVPGFIDCGSTLAVRGRPAEEYFEITPEVRCADTIDLDDDQLREARLAGVTTFCVTPGDRNVIGGLGALFSSAPGTLQNSLLRDDAFLAISLTKASFAGNRSLRFSSPSSYYHRIPKTRMGTVFLVRRVLFEVLEADFPAELVIPERIPDEIPELSIPVLEESSLSRLLSAESKKVLVESIQGKRPIRIRADRKQEIRAALSIADEFQIPIIIEGFLEGVSFIAEIARKNIPVLIMPGAHIGSFAAPANKDLVQDLARRLEEKGVQFGFFSNHGNEVAAIRERVVLDIRFGLSDARALRAMTLDAAKILGVDDRVGSLEPGKVADIVAISGHPFSMSARVDWVMVEGKIIGHE